MTRTCSSQTIHNFIGFLYVTGWQSCWYWEVFHASSRKLRGTHRIHFEEISHCVEFSEAVCCSASNWSHIWYFWIKVLKFSKKKVPILPPGTKKSLVRRQGAFQPLFAVIYGRRKYSQINVQKQSLKASGSSIRLIGIVMLCKCTMWLLAQVLILTS